MREVSKELEARPGASTPGWLNECLIDGDAAAIRSARRARRKAVSVSLALQVGLLATALVVPLFAHVAVPRPDNFIPIPPYAPGGGSNQPRRAPPPRQYQEQNQPSNRRSIFENIVQPAKIPTTIEKSSNSSMQS